VDEPVLEALLRCVVNDEGGTTFELPVAEAGVLADVPDATGREVDEGLRELEHRGWARGERYEGDGSIIRWSALRPTVAGLRHLGEWPPEGLEYLSGGWDDLTWGRVDQRVLSRLFDSTPDARLVVRLAMGEDDGLREWESYLRLHEAGLIDADMGSGYLGNLRVITAGRDALHPPDDDPLVRARQRLRQGAKADAVTAVVDEALKPCLVALAGARGLTPDQLPTKIASLNDELKKLGAYGDSPFVSEAVRAQVDAWLKLRNAVDHGEGASIAERWIELMIDGVEHFLREHA